jgi:hypothetical protein
VRIDPTYLQELNACDYLDDNVDYLMDDNDLDEEERRIEYADTKKKEKVWHCCMNCIKGEPQEPLYKGMTAAEATEAEKMYKKDQKRYLDETWPWRMTALEGSPFSANHFTGNQSPMLHIMADVCCCCLPSGQTFSNRKIIIRCVAEEANLQAISFLTNNSGALKIWCTGKICLVHATNSKKSGWMIMKCQVWEEEAGIKATSATSDPSCLPYRKAWIVHLILATIGDTNGIEQVLGGILEPYGKPYCFTDGIIQKSQTDAQQLIFGCGEGQTRVQVGPLHWELPFSWTRQHDDMVVAAFQVVAF